MDERELLDSNPGVDEATLGEVARLDAELETLGVRAFSGYELAPTIGGTPKNSQPLGGEGSFARIYSVGQIGS